MKRYLRNVFGLRNSFGTGKKSLCSDAADQQDNTTKKLGKSNKNEKPYLDLENKYRIEQSKEKNLMK